MTSDVLGAVERTTRAIANSATLDDALAALHAGLRDALDVAHAFVFWADPEAQRLFVVSSHGFSTSGVGSEVAFGEGPVGICAERRVPLRFTNVMADLRYARAVAAVTGPAHRVDIPLPQLPQTGSVIAVPIEAHGRVHGVVAAQHEHAGYLSAEHESALRILATALGLQAVLDDLAEPDAPAQPTAPADATPASEPLRVKHYVDDDSIFIDGEYVVRGVAGKLLARLLVEHQQTGRTQFTNRELRLEVGNKLAWAKDNLESRLILLRKRLDEKRCGVALKSAGRGRIALAVARAVHIEVVR